MEWASLIVVENATNGRAIVEHHGAGGIGFRSRRIRGPNDHRHGCLRIVCREAFQCLGSLPRLSEYFPGQLFNWGASLVIGEAQSAWPAFWIALGLIAAALAAAWLVFRRQEL